MSLDRLFTWWNAVYSVPLAFVLVLLAITSILSLIGGALGELSHGDAHTEVDAGHDVDVDADVDADVHLDVDHDMDVDHDVQVDHDLEADLNQDGHVDAVEQAVAVARGHTGADHGLLVSALVLLGVGRAPLLMVLQTLVLLWGVIGISLHQALGAGGPGALAWSIPLTLVLSLLGTRAFAAAFGHVFKPYETAAVKRDQLVGRTGRVVFPVSSGEGTVHVRDVHGTLHRVRARCAEATLESGQEIIVLGYDPGEKVYQVDDVRAFADRP